MKTKHYLVAIGLSVASAGAMADLRWTFTTSGLGVSSGATLSSSLQFAGRDTVSNALSDANCGVAPAVGCVSVKSYADTVTGGDTVAVPWGGTASQNKLFQANTKVYSGGLGVQWVNPGANGVLGGTGSNADTFESTADPEHTMDNCGNYNATTGACSTGSNTPEDSLLFSFSDLIALKEISIGYYRTDADITVLAWTGPGAPTVDGKTYASNDAVGGSSAGLIPSGWTLVGSYANLQDTGMKATITQNTDAGSANDIKSSYWLIGAYNSRIDNQGWTDNNDFIKLSKLVGAIVTPPQGHAPEPAALALMALTLPLLRRRGRAGRGA
ncbi:MAG: exosortase-dependent surface protein XDP1 [Gammaproteobacteria bacterium]